MEAKAHEARSPEHQVCGVWVWARSSGGGSWASALFLLSAWIAHGFRTWSTEKVLKMWVKDGPEVTTPVFR